MQFPSSAFRPLLRAKLFRLALFAAAIPSFLLLLGTLLPKQGSQTASADLAEQLRAHSESQLKLDVEAQAGRIDARLEKIGHSVVMLRDYGAEILANPAAYAAPWKPAVNPQQAADAAKKAAAATTPHTAGSAAPAAPIAPKTIDKSLFYAISPDGALRKVLGQGTAVFYRRPDTGSYPGQAMQKLYASTALDPLLSGLVDNDPLCTSMYFVTEDGLLRTYPFLDTAAWSPDKDPTKLSMYAWSADKANSSGLVWTTPYVSHLSGKWVVACTAAVKVGDRQAGIAGCEVDLSKFNGELLSFSLGGDFLSWISRSDGIVLGAQSGVFEDIGVRAIGQAEIPSEKHPGEVILAEANIFESGFSEIGDQLKGENGEVLSEALVPQEADGSILFVAPLESSGWQIAGVATSPIVAAVMSQEQATAANNRLRTNLSLMSLLFGLLLVLLVTLLSARKIVDPIHMLTQQVEQTATNRGATPVAIADEGELGQLAHSIQRLVDQLRASDGQHEDVAVTAEPAVTAVELSEPQQTPTVPTNQEKDVVLTPATSNGDSG